MAIGATDPDKVNVSVNYNILILLQFLWEAKIFVI